MEDVRRRLAEVEKGVNTVAVEVAKLSGVPARVEDLCKEFRATREALFKGFETIKEDQGDIRVQLAGKQDAGKCHDLHREYVAMRAPTDAPVEAAVAQAVAKERTAGRKVWIEIARAVAAAGAAIAAVFGAQAMKGGGQ